MYGNISYLEVLLIIFAKRREEFKSNVLKEKKLSRDNTHLVLTSMKTLNLTFTVDIAIQIRGPRNNICYSGHDKYFSD